MKINTKPKASNTEISSEKPKKSEGIISPFSLPTEKSVKNYQLHELYIMLYGEKKIGKTSLAAQFPNALFLKCEDGTKGIDVFEVDIPNWQTFKGYLNSLSKSEHNFKTIVVDTIDVLYESCFEYICNLEGFEHPSELKFGKGWSLINTEFKNEIRRLLKLKLGIVFISHATEKEYLERGGGEHTKIVPTMTKQCTQVIDAIADIMIFYGYFGSERVLSIRGTDSLESGTRMRKSFWVKDSYEEGQKLIQEYLSARKAGTSTKESEKTIRSKLEDLRIQVVPAGFSEEETYYNLNLAFNNQQQENGKSITKKAPNVEKLAMQQKKNK